MSLTTDSPRLGSTIVVPGSTANLGGGFDTLGLAVTVYLRAIILGVDDDGAGRLTVTSSTPPVQGANALERAFTAAVTRTGRRAPSVRVAVESDIPMAAGLGSSAAATVAGLRVFQQVAGPLADSEVLGIATSLEGHADNAAPAMFGGLTSVVQVEGADPLVCRWSWPAELKLIVATPVVGLATSKARAALAPTVTRADAIFNLQRGLALIHALETRDYGRLREAVRDRWHQPARASLVPVLGDVLRWTDPDVLGAFLSGAGPSVAVLAVSGVDGVAARLAQMYRDARVEATVRVLSVHEAQAASSAQANWKSSVESRSDALVSASASASARGRTA